MSVELVEAMSLVQLKKVHDFYVTQHQILSQRVQFYAEEFDGVKELIDFNRDMAIKLKAIIEAKEPKAENVEESKGAEPAN